MLTHLKEIQEDFTASKVGEIVERTENSIVRQKDKGAHLIDLTVTPETRKELWHFFSWGSETVFLLQQD